MPRPRPTSSNGGRRRRRPENLAFWQRISDEYEARHARSLRRHRALSWGVWRIPESRLRLLGPVRGARVLELGCGAGLWSLALARRGARPVGMDFSSRHLAHAVANRRRARASIPLVRANAERLPFRTGVFDLVFCDWGAMTFADPRHTVPEAARVLRAGGRFVFATDSPIHLITLDIARDRPSRTLRRSYFGLHRVEFGEEVDYQLTFGEWVSLFRRHGLAIDALQETRPGPRSESSYRSRSDRAWARRWPMESIWQLRRESPTAAPHLPRSSERTARKPGSGP